MDRLLVLSDDPCLSTGLGRCVRELTKRFSKQYELAVAGWHHTPIRHDFPFYIYPLIKGDSEEGSQFQVILDDFQPHHLLCIGDIWDFGHLTGPVSQYRSTHPLSTYLWVTPDGEWTYPLWEEILRLFDRIASFSEFGAAEVRKLADVHCRVIYPGVDMQVFRRPPRFNHQENVKGDLNSKFIIVTIAQNTTRKQLPIALEIYAKFQQDHPDSHFVLLTNPHDPVGHNLVNVAKWLGLLSGPGRKLSFVRSNPRGGIPDQNVSWCLLLGHCFLLSSVGEGSCLPLFEAMACGVVPIGTDYSAISEVIGDRGFLMKPNTYMFGDYDVRRALPSIDEGVKYLTMLYEDWKSDKNLLSELSTKCIDFAQQYPWEKTAAGLLEMMEQPIEAPKFVFLDRPKHNDICVVIPSWQKACGIAEYTRNLINAMERTGQNIHVYPSNDLHGLLREREKTPFGIVHVQHEFSFFQDQYVFRKSLEGLRKAGLKTVVTLHSAVNLPAYNRMLLQSADRVILHADALKPVVLNGFGGENVRIIPSGCGTLADLSGIEDRRKELGIVGRTPIVGSFGFLRDQKGFHQVLQAVKLLSSKYPDILFFLVSAKHEFGNSGYDERFYRFIRNENAERYVLIYREHLTDERMIKTLQCADLFVMNYEDNPSGGGISAGIRTIMRTQRPIIAAQTLAFCDLVDEVAWLDGRLPEIIARAIETIWTNSALCERVVTAANARIARDNWDTVAKLHKEMAYYG